MSTGVAQAAQAGSFESSDCLVTITPGQPGSGVSLTIRSIVLNQFGDAIRAAVEGAIAEAQATDLVIDVNDRGALDFVLRARVLTAIARARGATA